MKPGVATARTHVRTIRTPEGVRFSLPLAGPVSRCLAWLLDALCLVAFAKAVQVVVALTGFISQDLSQAITMVLYFLFYLGYAMALEWYWNGQTVGKRLFGLRVMDVRGLRLRPSQIAIRNLLRAVDSLPVFYLLGGVVCLTSRYAQRLGDIAANTIVVKSAKVTAPRIDAVVAENRYNSLRAHPHLAARLRQQVTPIEADTALQALIRRDSLDPEARVDLFATMARHFKGKVAYPEEALAGISDEQYVRNVVDLVFRR
ncbi:MAG: RDD family protein [Desulfobacterales bacterium]|nr:RDD family protein [Desulfobacterales bacterium]